MSSHTTALRKRSCVREGDEKEAITFFAMLEVIRL